VSTYSTVQLYGQTLHLLPERAVFWADRKALLLSDIHLGKAGHFRRHGSAIPNSIDQVDIKRLKQLTEHFNIREVYIIGDLFHSVPNSDWQLFLNSLKTASDAHYHLIMGNHEVLTNSDYQQLGLSVYDHLQLGPFHLVHDPEDHHAHTEGLAITGHIHPAIRLTGPGKQSERLPCYHLTPSWLTLPAFGAFTGHATIQPKAKERVFVIAENQVIEIDIDTDSGS
jgi:DNA ligase-associated metallophosphoesterase